MVMTLSWRAGALPTTYLLLKPAFDSDTCFLRAASQLPISPRYFRAVIGRHDTMTGAIAEEVNHFPSLSDRGVSYKISISLSTNDWEIFAFPAASLCNIILFIILYSIYCP